LISNLGVPAVVNVTADEPNGPDKVNKIRDQVATTQPTRLVLNPDKQVALMQIIKSGSEAFERELRRAKSVTNSTITTEVQKFNEDLMNITEMLLTRKGHVV